MSALPDLQTRLRLLGISEDTKQNLRLFYPVFRSHIADILVRFYAHLLSFPEGKRIFANHNLIDSLKPRQMAHWSQLFSCQLDEAYVASAVRIGQIHFERRVAPYLYMAGYNFFHCEIIKVAAQNYDKAQNLSLLLASITRLVSLDMDLALSAYTREYWRRVQHIDAV